MPRLILISLLIAALLYSYLFTYQKGMQNQAGIEAQARQDLINKQADQVKVIHKEKVKIEVRYRDRIKTIYQLEDPTGCLDATLGDIGVLSTTSEN